MNFKLFLFTVILFTEFSQAKFLNADMVVEYEQFFLSLILLIIAELIILLYMRFKSKKLLKQQYKILFQKDMEIKTLKKVHNEEKMIALKKEHSLESKIVEMEQNLKSLEQMKKEGLKNQVVSKIEEYQNRRMQQLNSANISR